MNFGTDRKAFATNKSFIDAALHGHLKHAAEEIALPKTAMAIFRKRRLVWHFAVQTETTKPSVRQVKMNLITEPSLGTDAKTITDDQHADHQFRIDRRTTDRAVKRLKLLPYAFKIKKDIDLAE